MEEVDILIKHGKIFTQNSQNNIINDGVIAIKEGIIIDIGTLEEKKKLYEGKKEINARDKIIIPGLINTHTHLPMNLLRGFGEGVPLQDWLENYIFPVEKNFVNEKFVYLGALLGGLESIKNGITTVVDMYYFEDKVAKALKELGLRGIPCQSILEDPTPDFDTPEESLSFAKDFIKKWKDDDLITPGIAPHSIYTTNKDILLKTKKISDNFNVPLSIHAAENKKEVKEVKDKFSHRPINYLDKIGMLDDNVIAAHCVEVTEEEIEKLKKTETSVSHCPISNLKLSSGVSPIGKMNNYGVNLTLGTDGSSSNNNLNLWEEIKTSILLQNIYHKDQFLKASDVFSMTTKRGAKSLGFREKLGSIEENKLADIVILDYNSLEWFPTYDIFSNLVYSENGCNVEHVIINGEIVYYEREYSKIDQKEVIKEARNIVKNIKSSF